MGEKVPYLNKKVETATPPLWSPADGISKVGSLEGQRSLKLGHLPWVLLPSTLPIALVHRATCAGSTDLGTIALFCFNFLCTFLPLEGLTVTFRYSRFQSDVRRFNFSHFSFFEMFVNFLTCRFHKWDPQCSWERKTSEHLDTITSMSFPIGKEGDVLAKGKSSN